MSIKKFNNMNDDVAIETLLDACHCQKWATQMEANRPYIDDRDFLIKAEKVWFSLTEADWLEAFQAHPKIGDINSLKEKFKTTKDSAAQEQKGVDGADEKTLQELIEFNQKYEERYKFIFIIFATGKSAAEMLRALKARMHNSRAQELKSAAIEQSKITRLRLEKVL